jgi:hypothetical protein
MVVHRAKEEIMGDSLVSHLAAQAVGGQGFLQMIILSY